MYKHVFIHKYDLSQSDRIYGNLLSLQQRKLYKIDK